MDLAYCINGMIQIFVSFLVMSANQSAEYSNDGIQLFQVNPSSKAGNKKKLFRTKPYN